MSDIYDKISNHPLLNRMIGEFALNQFHTSSFDQKIVDISTDDIRKCVWMSSVLANSDKEEHRNKVQRFTSLLYLLNPNNIDIARACNVLYSRVGNLTAARLIKEIQNQDPDIDYYDSSLLLQLNLEKLSKSISVFDETIITTKFQKDLWEKLTTENHIIVSAPTSAGKSFIIKKYIKNCVYSNDNYKVLFVVPSRALINQVCEELRNEIGLSNVDIKSVYLPNLDAANNKKEIFVLTPERCLRLIKESIEHPINFDLIFVDEVQNVEDDQGRGMLFEYVFKELNQLFPHSKIICAGPNIIESKKLYEKVFGVKGNSIETIASPVFQIKTTLRPKDNNELEITIYSHDDSSPRIFNIQTDVDFKKSFNNSIGSGLKDVIGKFGLNEQNIIYAAKGNFAEKWAIWFTKSFQADTKKSDFVNELVDFLEEEIHPKYFLIDCLKNRCAFHHSKLPDVVRKEIEDGFLKGEITNLFCTSTLLQGVNLPANNLFIATPQKRHLKLGAFEFGNLIGRAGRIKDSLYGTVYCIEYDDNHKWSEELYNSTSLKEVTTSVEASLKGGQKFINELSKNTNQIPDIRDSHTAIVLRHKFLQSNEELANFLRMKQSSEAEIIEITEVLQKNLIDIVIPQNILRLNPTIDPIKQNELYKAIINSGIQNWIIPSIAHNENFYKRISDEDMQKLPFEKWSFHLQLRGIMQRLDDLFKIAYETWYRNGISISIKQMCVYGTKWLGNRPLSELIKSDIAFYTNHENLAKRIDPDNQADINKRINNVIQINSTVITHVLVKYLKVLNDILESLMTEEQKEKYKFSLSLTTMLELGTTETNVMRLISKGISRTIALKVFAEFKKVPGYEDIDIFTWLSTKQTLNLKPIYNRYLRKMKMLNMENNSVQ